MPIFVKQLFGEFSWVNAPSIKLKVSGNWKGVGAIFSRYSGIWRTVWMSYAWETTAYSTCDAACPTTSGSMNRTVTCKDFYGNPVADALCSVIAAKPATTQPCSITCTYQWQYSPTWFPCNAPCNATISTGTQSRSVWCQSIETGSTVDDTYCGGGKPEETKTCSISCRSRANTFQGYAVGYGYTSGALTLGFFDQTGSSQFSGVVFWTYNAQWDRTNDYWDSQVKNNGVTQTYNYNHLGIWPFQSPYNLVMSSYASFLSPFGLLPNVFTEYWKTTSVTWSA